MRVCLPFGAKRSRREKAARTAGESEGRRASFGARESADLLAWLDTLTPLDGPSPTFAAWGRSMGASTALRAAAADPRIAALILEAPGQMALREIEIPQPAEGEVLIRVAASSVNPIDYKMRSGAAKERFPVEFPAILGRDVAGIIRELGPDVDSAKSGFKVGDRVFALANATYALTNEVLINKDLTLNGNGAAATVANTAGANIIAAQVSLGTTFGANFNVSSGQSLTMAGQVNGGGKLTANGAGAPDSRWTRPETEGRSS